MDILYPRLSLERLTALMAAMAFGAIAGGAYGAVHDQISYAISPEYFTKMKFLQFATANFGWPERLFAAEVGVLATWWVGLIAAWILCRITLALTFKQSAKQVFLKAFGLVIVIAALSGLLGIALGIYETQGEGLAAWDGWRDDLRLVGVREFAIVAYLHGASYLGAILGLCAGVVYVYKSRLRQ